jgi:hypothetical protein
VATETSPYQEPLPPAMRTAGWNGSDLAIGSGLIVLLIALFLPWFSETVTIGAVGPIHGTADGPLAHGYLWAVLALTIVALAMLVARDSIGRIPANLPSAEQMLVGATGLAFVLTLLGVVFKPSGYTTFGPAITIPAISGGHVLVSVGWSYGGFVAVLAALAALIATYGTPGPLHSARRVMQTARRRRGAAP